MPRSKVFLLSPASAHGAKARPLLEREPRTPFARQLASPEGVALGTVFRYLSGLYFNGKLLYANAFASPPRTLAGEGVYVITLAKGLLTPETPVRSEDVRRFAEVEMGSEAYGRPLEESARSLATTMGGECDAVLLGSVGTGKYTDILLPIFGRRLLFPPDILSQGQLERGAFLMRCAKEGRELRYEPVEGLLSAKCDGARAASRRVANALSRRPARDRRGGG